MTGLAKVLVGLGVAVPVAGVAGGIYVAVTKSAVATQETQPLRTELSSASHSDHSQQVVQDSGHARQENQNLVDSGTTVTHTSAPQDNPDLKAQEQLAKEEEITTGNCTIIDPLKKILEVVKQDETEYYSVSCDNTRMRGAGEDGNIIPNTWEGAFPKSIFKKQDLGNGQKLEIKVKEEDNEDETFSVHDTGEQDLPFSITLSGNSFVGTDNSLLSAKWNYYEDDTFDEESKVLAKVKLTQPNSEKNIYLLWTQE